MHSAVQVIYVEAISNPLIQEPDLPGVVAFARQHGLTSVIDATFATPVLLQPVSQLGFDLVVHSATKYLNGHSDVIAGVVKNKTFTVLHRQAFQNHRARGMHAGGTTWQMTCGVGVTAG
jgi:cystathionine gamma-synthase/cystathionine gamma-lyase/cystathionine beta-lyase